MSSDPFSADLAKALNSFVVAWFSERGVDGVDTLALSFALCVTLTAYTDGLPAPQRAEVLRTARYMLDVASAQ